MEELITAIEDGLTNRYIVSESDEETLYVYDRETKRHFEISVMEEKDDSMEKL